MIKCWPNQSSVGEKGFILPTCPHHSSSWRKVRAVTLMRELTGSQGETVLIKSLTLISYTTQNHQRRCGAIHRRCVLLHINRENACTQLPTDQPSGVYSQLRSLLPLLSVKITHLLTNTMNLLPVLRGIIMEDLTKLVWGKIPWYLKHGAGKAIEYSELNGLLSWGTLKSKNVESNAGHGKFQIEAKTIRSGPMIFWSENSWFLLSCG